MKIIARIPTVNFGYIEMEMDGSIEEALKIVKEADDIWDRLTKASEQNDSPTFLGQKKTENNHVYIAVKNEGSDKLYWLIKTV